MKNKILVQSNDYRPCYVNGKKALFHKWVDYAKPVPPSVLPFGDPGGQMRYTYALVEFENGQISLIDPLNIKFDSSLLNEYAFRDSEKETTKD